jgi:hypothetical protein
MWFASQLGIVLMAGSAGYYLLYPIEAVIVKNR